MDYTVSKKRSFYYVEQENEYLFVPLLDTTRDNNGSLSIKQYLYSELPDVVYGKILTNTTGYNPSGWWKYVNIKKEDIVEK